MVLQGKLTTPRVTTPRAGSIPSPGTLSRCFLAFVPDAAARPCFWNMLWGPGGATQVKPDECRWRGGSRIRIFTYARALDAYLMAVPPWLRRLVVVVTVLVMVAVSTPMCRGGTSTTHAFPA